MKKATLLMLCIGLATAAGCQSEKSAEQPMHEAPASAKEQTRQMKLEPHTWKDAGVELNSTYKAYPGFQQAVADLPENSLDAIIEDMNRIEQQHLLIDLRVEQTKEGKPPRSFTTTVYFKGGNKLSKTWQPARSNTSGRYRALITAPFELERAETRPVAEPEKPAPGE